jgi:hypothetical protein
MASGCGNGFVVEDPEHERQGRVVNPKRVEHAYRTHAIAMIHVSGGGGAGD